jgi:predicted Rossmann-fold nucleotide-binding protein
MSETTSVFIREDPWRIFRIMAEFVDSFQTLSQVGPAVTIFGSARTRPNDKYYRAAVAIAKGLASTTSPSSPAAARASWKPRTRARAQGGGKSVGLNIELPHEQSGNRLRQRAAAFPLFFSRARSAS